MDELWHYGVKGMKWGVRRYQNEDGTWTDEGKKHRSKRAVFVSGSSKTESPDSPYYRKKLPKDITDVLDRYMNDKVKFIVGDAPGIDRQVQRYLNDKKYKDVDIYGPGKQVRYTANKDWKTHPIDAPEFEEGSKEWLAKKDIAMEKASTEGFAVILDEGASATRKNISRLIENNKDVKVYQLNQDGSDAWNNDWNKTSDRGNINDVNQILGTLSKAEKQHVVGNHEYKESKNSVYRNVVKIDGKPAGFIEAFRDPDLEPNEAVVISAVGKDYRGKKLSNEMAKELVNNMPSGIDTLYWETTKDNPASAKAAVNAGFVKSIDYDKDDDNYIYRRKNNG